MGHQGANFSHYPISGDRDLFWYIFSHEKGENLDGPPWMHY